MSEVPAEAVNDVSRVTGPAVSPDGERIAYVTHNSDAGGTSLFVAPADGSEEPHRLGSVNGVGTIEWSPDGSKLGVQMVRESEEEATGGGDGEPQRQVWVYDLERGGEPRQITDRDEGVREFDWSPDGEKLVVSARDPTEEERRYLEQRSEGGPIEVERGQFKANVGGYLDSVSLYLFVVDVETGEETRLDDAHSDRLAMPWPAWSGMEPSWSPDGDRIAFLAQHEKNPDETFEENVYAISPDGSDLQRLTDGELFCHGIAWSPSGERLVFAGRDAWNWYTPTEAYVVEPGDQYRSISGSLDRTISWHGMPRWLDDETLLALVGDEGRTRFVRFPIEDEPERVFPAQGETEAIPEYDVSGDTVACIASHPTDGRDLYAFDVGDLESSADPRVRMTNANAELLEEYEFPSCHRFAFDSADVSVDGLLYHPPDFDPDDPDPRPLILCPHGGPTIWDEPSFDFEHGYWTSRGYLFLEVNYRGSASYGREFCEVLRDSPGTVETDDQIAAVDAAVDRGWADPDRLFCAGGSYGALSTVNAFIETDRFVAGAADNGTYDQRAAYGTTDVNFGIEDEHGFPWENPEEYDALSPIMQVDEIETPLLISVGSNDQRCPPSQSERLYYSLHRLDVPTKLVIYPGGTHDRGGPGNYPDEIHRLEQKRKWFEKFSPGSE